MGILNMESKNQVQPSNMQVPPSPTVADLKNLDLFTNTKGTEHNRCEAVVTESCLQFLQKQSDGRMKVLSEWPWQDFIGIEVEQGKTEYMEGGHDSLRPIGTVFESKCCGPNNVNKRVIKEGRLYHGRNDKVIYTVRNIIMQYFWDWLKKNHGAGIPENDTSYIHPENLKPWEKKAIVYINPFAGLRQAGKLFMTLERYLRANGFRMDTVTTFRAGQVQEEMKLMEGTTFKSYYCRLVFSGDG